MDTHKTPMLPTAHFRSNVVVIFFVGSFVLAWTWWALVRLLWTTPSTALILPGAWAPTIVAGFLIRRLEGRDGFRIWLTQLLRWRVKWYWYVIVIGGPSLAAALALGINVGLGGGNFDLTMITARFGLTDNQLPLLLALTPIIFLVTLVSGGPIAEELGWRGFAQPRLQAWVGAERAGLIIGILWSLWHLPLFLILPSAKGNIPLLWYIPLVSTWGILFAWIYNATGKSVLLCMLFHAGINFMLGALGLLTSPPSPLLFAIFTVVSALCAGVAWAWLIRGRQSPPSLSDL